MDSTRPPSFFLDRLRKSNLFPPNKLEELIRKLKVDQQPSAVAAAKLFMKRRLISRLQAELLLDSAPQRLFIDGYKLIELVGSGGMGRVFIAEEPNSNWKVALKVLSPNHRQDAGLLARFQLEAEIGLKLQHPNILRTRELNSTEDIYGRIHYAVLDFVKGPTLAELLEFENKPVPWAQACDAMMQTAAGLHYMHEKRMVHRDIKPSNLIISSNGSVKLLDFGLTRIDEDDEEFSMAMIFGHQCMGTPDYIAPEQTLNSYEVDRRADIYSLGCTFYHLLCNEVPFPAPTVREKIAGHRKLKPVKLEKRNPEVPARLSAIVHKMLCKQPENRFQTAADVVRYLEPLAERQTVDFNFREILKRRVQDDHKRSTYLKRLSELGKNSGVSGKSSVPGAAKSGNAAPGTSPKDGGDA